MSPNLALIEARKCCLLAKTGVLLFTKQEIGGNWKIQCHRGCIIFFTEV